MPERHGVLLDVMGEGDTIYPTDPAWSFPEIGLAPNGHAPVLISQNRTANGFPARARLYRHRRGAQPAQGRPAAWRFPARAEPADPAARTGARADVVRAAA